MKKNSMVRFVVLTVLLVSFGAVNTFAAEVTIEKTKVPGVVLAEKITKTADNFIVMFDSSSSMNEPLGNTGLTKLEAAKQLLKGRSENIPDLGYMGGLYLYTPFKAVYEMQKFDRKKFVQAVDQLPEKGKGATLLQEGLRNLDGVLAGLSGRTVVAILTDGYYSKMPGSRKPSEIARNLADKYNVCFYVISTAKGSRQKELLKSVAKVNACSRVIPFDQVFAKPVYIAGGLFVIDTEVIPFVATLKRIADIEIKNALFDFDSAEVRSDDYDELNILGTFLQNNPKTYTILTGYTDSTGPAEYNLELARQRAESVEAYLTSNFNVGVERIVTQWYGIVDPVAGNDTSEGRQKNRRVECMVMGFD
jgi:OOP family OmpA-OmpF porin